MRELIQDPRAMVAFSLVLLGMWLRGQRELVCGCFGPNGQKRSTFWLVVRNVLLLVPAGLCPSPYRGALAPDRSPTSVAVPAGDGLLVVAAAMSLFVLLVLAQAVRNSGWA